MNNTRSIKVLLVEDNPGDARLIQEILSESKGTLFELELADRLLTAREYLTNGDIDFILLDLSLPDSQGLDTFRKMRAHVPEMPIVVLSGLNDETIAIKAVQEGAQDYLVKGQVDPNVLIRSIRYAIERKKAEETIRKLAYYDPLTDLPNRVLFNDHLSLALAHARRNESKLAVMLLDLDRFKVVNDSLGHSMGDRLLKVVGGQLRNLLRKEDTVSRMGGDEFLLLLPEIEDGRSADNAAQRILDSFRIPLRVDKHTLSITVSIGISIYPDDSRDADTLMKHADIAMYKAKDRGRNCCQRFSLIDTYAQYAEP